MAPPDYNLLHFYQLEAMKNPVDTFKISSVTVFGEGISRSRRHPHFIFIHFLAYEASCAVTVVSRRVKSYLTVAHEKSFFFLVNLTYCNACKKHKTGNHEHSGFKNSCSLGGLRQK